MFPPTSGHRHALQIKKRMRKTIQLLKIRCSIPDGINICFSIPEIIRLALRPKQQVTQWLPEFTETPREWDVSLNTSLSLEGRLRISGAGVSLFSYIFHGVQTETCIFTSILKKSTELSKTTSVNLLLNT